MKLIDRIVNVSVMLLLFSIWTNDVYSMSHRGEDSGPVPDNAVPKIWTPGVVRDLTLDQICATKWGKDKRSITIDDKKLVSKWYDFPWSERKTVEYDHLVPRCLGGADDVKNLWPEPRSGQWNAYIKDKLEAKACRMVCDGELDLKKTQQAFIANWVELYKKIFPTS